MCQLISSLFFILKESKQVLKGEKVFEFPWLSLDQLALILDRITELSLLLFELIFEDASVVLFQSESY